MNWRARISPERLIVASACARPYVQAAVAAGYEVIAADAFSDLDTRRAALQVIQLDYEQGGFNAAEVRCRLFPLLAGNVGFVYGSGFESQPHLLKEIARRCPVLGNTAEAVMSVKDPGRFFSVLSALAIPFPETSLRPPVARDGWLSKRVGGSGGTHIMSEGPGRYYQRQLPGKPYSLLFLADGRRAAVVGYNEQWLAPTPEMPYRYGGAVSQATLPEAVRTGMLDAAQRLTAEFGLRGLNSLDCLVAGEHYWVLEVNPRLSATFAMYDADAMGARLFEAHLRSCAGGLAKELPPERAQAHLIYYATCDTKIPPDMQWPEWVADFPLGGISVNVGEPLCTITATASTADEAKMLALERAEKLTQQIY